MRQIHGLAALAPIVLSTVLGCSGVADPTSENVGQSTAALTTQVTKLGVSSELMPVDGPFPAGIAASEDLIFTGSPFEGRVIAHDRRTHATVGELPAPPNGFVLPFILKHVHDNKIAVLDAGGFPSPKPFIPAAPSVYEYHFNYSHGVFSANLTRTISTAGQATIGFSEDAIQLDDGRYLIDDAVLGSIWIANTDGTIEPGIVPQNLDPTTHDGKIPQTFFCDTMPQVTVGGVPFLFTASTVPGISSMTTIGDTLYFTASCFGAVFSLPLSVLTDHRQPYQRAASLHTVDTRPPGVLVEELLGLTKNPYDANDKYLYAADALQLRVIRIDSKSGKRDVVGDDQQLFNFPSSLGFAPPNCDSPSAPLLTLSNQQQLTTLLNDAIHQDILEPPFLATITYLKHDR